MLTTPHYIAWSAGAAGALKQRDRLLGESHRIIVVQDDLRLGALEDADQVVAPLRDAAWKTIWRAQWWCDEHACETALPDQLAASRRELLSALTRAEPFVVWVGNHAHDALMLAMIASVASPQTELSVVDIATCVPASHRGPYTVGMCTPDALLPLQPTPLNDDRRAALAAQWRHWKQHARGWREADASGHLVDRPLDWLDDRLLARIAALGRQSASRAVAEVMNDVPGIASVEFLFWRLDVLRQTGRVVMAASPGQQAQAPLVALA